MVDNTLHYNEGLRFWTASQVGKGVKLGVVQHGGHYGTGLWSSHEFHEIAVSDRFFTWGWREAPGDKTFPLPVPKLSKNTGPAPRNPTGRVLVVLNLVPPYAYRMLSFPIGPQGLDDGVNDQIRFAKAVKKEVRGDLVMRPYVHDHWWQQAARIRDSGLSLNFLQRQVPSLTQLSGCRVCIYNYNSTAFLETFAVDFPTLLFWNPAHWELRPEAAPYFEALHRVGVLHYDPESAAAKLNEIHGDVAGWWAQPEIQQAKDEFCAQFALTDPGWLSRWRRELLQLAGSAGS